MDQVSFKANFVRKVGVLKRDDIVYRRKKVSFVEFDKNNKNDIHVLSQISNEWGDSFTLFNDMLINTKNVRIFGLTSQAKDFVAMLPSKIIGLISILDKPRSLTKTIEMLQKRPTDNDYKHVGKALVSSAQAKYSEDCLKVFSTQSAIGFYEDCGFQRADNHLYENHLIWFKDI